MTNKQYEGDPVSGKIMGWNRDPYDPAFDDTAIYSAADDETHDAQFPEHPLARIRQHLRDLPQNITLDPMVLKSRPFLKK